MDVGNILVPKIFGGMGALAFMERIIKPIGYHGLSKMVPSQKGYLFSISAIKEIA